MNVDLERETCLEALQKAANEIGHAPTVNEYKALACSPPYNTIIARYGTWLDALDDLDVDRIPRFRFTETDCIEASRPPMDSGPTRRCRSTTRPTATPR